MRRNSSARMVAANLHFFSSALATAGKVSSRLELGANVGMNLSALRLLYPDIRTAAVEINPAAARTLAELIGDDNVYTGSILDYEVSETFDLVLVKGVMIHTNPESLPIVYDKIFQASARLVLNR